MKKFISLTICIVLIISTIAIPSFSAAAYKLTLSKAIENYEALTGETVNTNRYYFLMPNGENGEKGKNGEYCPSFFNDYSTKAAVYWSGTEKIDPEGLGFDMYHSDSNCVFYADVPDFVETLSFNNNISNIDDISIVQEYCVKTFETETKGHENMIYVVSPDINNFNEFYLPYRFGGEWYYYYGGGCYGTKPDGNEYDCIRDDHDHENLYINFDPSGTDWTNYEKIYCHVIPQNGSSYPSKTDSRLCTDYDNDGIYTYDLNKCGIKFTQYTRYEVCFYTDTDRKTCPLLMQIGNIKDTVYATNEFPPYDLKKQTPIVKWTNDIMVESRPVPSLKDVLNDYDKENGTTTPTYRYYFLMPNGENGKIGDVNTEWVNVYYGEYAQSWHNNYSDKAGIYWWSQDIFNPESWPGYTMEKADTECVFYADVPQSVDTVIFTNTLDGGMIEEHEIHSKARQSAIIPCYIDEDFAYYHPKGVKNFDNMIFVLNPSLNNLGEFSTKPVQYSGEWHYYYGNGCYGDTKNGGTDDCMREDHDHGRKLILKEKFEEYSGIVAENSLSYSGPLYYHNDENSNKKWFLAKSNCGYSDYQYLYGTFGDYIFYNSAIYSPSLFSYYIYSYDYEKFYTFEQAWDNGISGIEEAFTEYLCQKDDARIIGDADNDNVLSVMDATEIQRAQAGIIKLYDSISNKHYYGDKLGCRNDVDHDGERSVLDATAIQHKLAQLS
ncbi:MAG: hypothetical protein IKB73_01160 [Ruminococcus sp.]|nr:hypothetical protein [Ruminococcus sp.]